MSPPDEALVLFSPAEITGALSDERLVPPPAPASDVTMALRARMARFSPPSLHGPRRAAVETAIAAVDVGAAAERAKREVVARIERAGERSHRVEVITMIGRPVPVATIAAAVGVPHGDLDEVVRDVDAIAAVIGRGLAPCVEADEAVDRLTARFAAHPLDTVAVLSILYQSMDATAALVATRLIDRVDAGLSPVPLARTVRVAATAADVAGRQVSTGTPVHLEIGTAGLWFGAGSHACPGRILAETIADAIVSSIIASGAAIVGDAIELDADHRPVAVWLDVGRRTQ